MRAALVQVVGPVTAWADDRPYVGRWAVPAAAVVAASVLGVTTGAYWAFLGVEAITTALLALSVGIVFNRAGMLALCPLSFAALGAWVAGWLNVHHRISFVLVMAAAAVASLPAGIIVGGLAVRLRGMNLAIATMGLAAITSQVLNVFPIPGQDQGTAILRPGFAQSQSAYFLFCLAALVVAGVAVTVVSRGRAGAAWAMLRSERATAAVGINVALAKLSVFVVSGVIASVAGVLLTAQSGIVDTSSFSASASLQVVVIAVLAGAGRMEGAVAAGVLGAFFTELLLRIGIPTDLAGVFFGVGALQILSRGGEGVAGQQQAKRAVRRFGRRAQLTRSAPTATLTMEPGSAEASAARGAVDAAARATPRTGSSDSAPATRDRAAPGGRPVAREPALEISHLTVRYGAVTALEDVTLAVPPGMVTGLIGPNGAGKTTLLDAATGFVPATSGVVKLNGRPVSRMPPHRRARAGLRRTFQQVRIAGELTVAGYMRFAAGNRLAAGQIDEALALFECPPADRVIATLDVPARRQVELAAAVAARPCVLLLDEPAAGLGEAESAALAQRLAQIPRVFGVAVLLVEHDVDLVRAACRAVTVLDYGKVLAAGDPQDVLSSALVREAYLGTEGDP
jgi:branched-chain amino acid transport system permease protein